MTVYIGSSAVAPKPTRRERYAQWRSGAVVQNVIAALCMSSGFLAWSPLSSDSLEVAVVLVLVVGMAALGRAEERNAAAEAERASRDV